ncbi:MAG: B12-binding domain-containing radical SAM protein [Deltaproteobacteria bacterium]|nr:B12-binding domain-containing radical SAM protein [Deltaproteobacteria bacterium]
MPPVRRIVLVEPRPEDSHIFSRFPMPRLGVVILGTLLRDLGYEVSVFVESVAPLDWDVVARADLVGFSAITSTARRSYALADRVRGLGIPVVMGGPHPTHRPDDALGHSDWVLRGEAEATLPVLVEALGLPEEAREAALDRIPGLSRRKDGAPVHAPIAPLEPDLDRWPDPDPDLVHGHHESRSLHGYRIVPIQTSRGCPYDCSFCTVTTTFGRRVRYRSVERVVAEMARHDLAHTHFFFYDDNFAADPRRVRALLAGIRSLPRKTHWSAQVRADVARDTALLDEMRETGCGTLYLGLESVHPESLEAVHKQQRVSETATFLDRIADRGIEVHGMFIFGFDNEPHDIVEATVAFARRHRVHSVQFMILTPLPGSRWGDEVESQGRLITHDWSLFDAHHVCFRPEGCTPAELQRRQMVGHDRFYAWSEVPRRALAGDWAGVALVLYARNLNRTWQRRNRPYLAWLEEVSRPAAPLEGASEEASAAK